MRFAQKADLKAAKERIINGHQGRAQAAGDLLLVRPSSDSKSDRPPPGGGGARRSRGGSGQTATPTLMFEVRGRRAPTLAPHGTRPVLAANQVPIFVYGCIRGSITKHMFSSCPYSERAPAN